MNDEFKLIVFHALKDYDLDKIAEFGGYSIAPSIGIAHDPRIVLKFGDIVFLGDLDMLERIGVIIYDRDVWSPTMNDVPDTIYFLDPSATVESMRNKMPLKERRIVRDGLREASEKIDPRSHARMYLTNYNELYDYWNRVIRYSYPEFGNEDEGFYDWIGFIADNSFKEMPRTKENISEYLKTQYEDIRGVDMFAPASAVAAKRISVSEIKQRGYEILTNGCKLDTDELSHKQWEWLYILHRLNPGWNPFSLHEIAGDMLKPESFEGFKQVITEYYIDLDEAEDKLSDVGGLRGLYDGMIETMIEIPSEYFEAKTFDPVDINEFHTVLVPGSEYIKKLKDAGYRMQIIPYFGEEDLIKKLGEVVS